VLPALRVTRAVADSVGLTAEQRAANLDGAFTVPRRVADRLRRAAALGARIVLLDDVCTTGSTFREAARSLAALGVTVEAAAVVAATPRRVG
jgi:predicted amidophosphoribosyltransferase